MSKKSMRNVPKTEQPPKRDFHEKFFTKLMEELEKRHQHTPEITMRVAMLLECAAHGSAMTPGAAAKVAAKAAPSIAEFIEKEIKIGVAAKLNSMKEVPNA